MKDPLGYRKGPPRERFSGISCVEYIPEKVIAQVQMEIEVTTGAPLDLVSSELTTKEQPDIVSFIHSFIYFHLLHVTNTCLPETLEFNQ